MGSSVRTLQREHLGIKSSTDIKQQTDKIGSKLLIVLQSLRQLSQAVPEA